MTETDTPQWGKSLRNDSTGIGRASWSQEVVAAEAALVIVSVTAAAGQKQ